VPSYLVTGGAGFVGSHLCEELLGRGHGVVVLDDLSGGVRERVMPGAEFIHGSVTEPATVDTLFAQRHFDGVFHLAAFTAEAISHAVKRHNYETNLMGSVNLINAALRTGVGFFGFASSVGVYGHGPTPMRESDVPEPADSYGLVKLMVERELDITMRYHGLPYTAFRMHNIYGEWQNMRDPYRNAVAIFLNQIMRGEPITVYGDGQQVRAFTYIKDIVTVLADAAQLPPAWGQAFNVGASKTNTVMELVQQVTAAMGVPEHPVQSLPSRNEVMVAYTDTSLAASVFGERAETPLEEGLARTVAWAREHGPVDLSSSFALELEGDQLPQWARLVEQRLRADQAEVKSDGRV
jgi:UDP-glucose 4-epimerase